MAINVDGETDQRNWIIHTLLLKKQNDRDSLENIFLMKRKKKMTSSIFREFGTPANYMDKIYGSMCFYPFD